MHLPFSRRFFFKLLLFSIAIHWIFFLPLFAQNDKEERKEQEKDSLKIYKQIKKISDKKKLTRLLYEEIFVMPTDAHIKQVLKKTTKTTKKYEGKIIRKVYINSLDPFGYDIYDTSQKAKSIIEKSGNFIHIKSKKSNIKNFLLFHKGDSLDYFTIKESERLIRASGYIRDAIITVKSTKSKDSVDVYVYTQDKWAINFDAQASTKSYSGTFLNNNFLGLGHNLSQRVYSRGWQDSVINLTGLYSVPYIRNTFITFTGFYSTDKYNNYRGVQLKRDFYSPLTQWAGGILTAKYKYPTMLFSSDTGRSLFTLERNNYDLWGAHSIGIGVSESERQRATRFVYGLRYSQNDFHQTIPINIDKYATFQSHKTVFSTFGFTYRGFYKDNYIFRYGITEDVPVGKNLAVTLGIDSRAGYYRFYTGMSAGIAKRIEGIGYVATKFEIGSYFKQGKEEQGVARISANYFTELIALKRWRMRQFISMDAVYGITRDVNEFLTINNQSGLRGFNSPTLMGTNKLVVISQTQFYLPYTFIGFRFAPILYIGLGQIGNDKNIFLTQRIYPVFAFGMQIRNELLVLNTFQFIIGIYPEIPGIEGASYRINSIRTYDYQFRNYEVGRPDVVGYY